MTNKKKNDSSEKEVHPDKPTIAEMMADFKKRTTSIYSVNGKFRSQLTETKEGGWICQIWTVSNGGNRARPMLRNVQPFVTKDEAIQMAQRCFAQYTGDDRYFAEEDVWKENETN